MLFLCLFAAYSMGLFAAKDPFNAYITLTENHAQEGDISIAIKDNIDLAGFPTTAGSLALLDNIAKNDAFLVRQLKQHGYHISGKTNLSEWANFRSENSISGWSSHGGQTLNPHGDNLNPCGSSSGSAVAVASGLVDVAVGTETNGSISCPASVNGIVGFKPTVGMISREGIIPISSSQDTAGPMGRSVEIIAHALDAMAGPDPMDPITLSAPNNFSYDFTSNLKNNGISGKRLGLLSSGEDYPDASLLLNKITQLVEMLGGTIVLIDDQRKYPGDDEYFLLLYEFKIGLEKYLAKSSTTHKSLASLIAFNEAHAQKVMPYFKQEIFIKSSKTLGQKARYVEALTMVQTVKDDFNNLLRDHQLDAFIGLTRNPAWKIDNKGGDDAAMSQQKSFGNGVYAAIAGNPHITLPLASLDGLPVGVSLIGHAWSDSKILQMAYDLELHQSQF